MTVYLRAQESGSAALFGRAAQFSATRRNACVLALLAMFAAAPARAAEWPTRPVAVVVPFAAGGFTDTLARFASKHLSEKFGQPFVVENRPGAGGALAAAYVAAAAPDGYTLFFGSASQLGISPIIQKVSYQSESFAPIAVFGTIPFLMGIKASLPAKTVPEFVTYAKMPVPASSTTGLPATAPPATCSARVSRHEPASIWSTCRSKDRHR